MEIFKSLFQAPEKKELGLPAQANWSLIKGLWVPFQENDKIYVEKAFKAIPIVQTIISQIIDRASDAPGIIMRVKDKKAFQNYYSRVKYANTDQARIQAKAWETKSLEQLDQHDFLEVMENPNPMQTGKELREDEMGYLLLTGNSIEYAASPSLGSFKGRPRELWSIPSPCVVPYMSGDRRKPVAGYTINYLGGEPIPESQVMHVKYFNPVSGVERGLENMFWGLSPLRSSLSLISQKKYADIAQGTLFANMAPAGLISGDTRDDRGELQEDQALSINQHFRQNHMGVYNAGDILVTPANVKWVNIGLSPADLSLLEWNQEIDKQIAKVYRYPQALLTDGGVVANSEEASKQFINNAVLPIIRRYDDARTKKLREWYQDDSLVYMSDTDIFPELQVDKDKLVQWMKRAEVFTIGEIRQALGYEDKVDESRVLVNRSLVPLSDVLQGPDLPTDQNNQDF